MAETLHSAGLTHTGRNKSQIHYPERSRDVSRPCRHTPLTATTPFRVPRNAVPPARDSDEKCGSPSLISSRLLTAPSAGSSWYNVPPLSLPLCSYLVTQTAPPPTTGDPFASDGPRHSTRILRWAAFTAMAAMPSFRHGSYTVEPSTAAAPNA